MGRKEANGKRSTKKKWRQADFFVDGRECCWLAVGAAKKEADNNSSRQDVDIRGWGGLVWRAGGRAGWLAGTAQWPGMIGKQQAGQQLKMRTPSGAGPMPRMHRHRWGCLNPYWFLTPRIMRAMTTDGVAVLGFALSDIAVCVYALRGLLLCRGSRQKIAQGP